MTSAVRTRTAATRGDKHAHQEERTMKPTVSNVIRWAGFAGAA
jgi:hypothetical protein